MPKQKNFQFFNSIKSRLSQKQNIFKMFLAAVFCFALFGAAGEGRAHFTISPDKFLVTETGQRLFPVGIYEICNIVHDNKNGYEGCSASINKMSNSMYSAGGTIPSDTAYWDAVAPLFEIANIYYQTSMSSFGSMGSRINAPYFGGYYQIPDEPSSEGALQLLKTRYNNLKVGDDNHPVFVSTWTYKPGSTSAADVADITIDALFSHHSNCGYSDRFNEETNCSIFGYYLEDFIFSKERHLRTNILSPMGANSIEQLPDPLWTVFEAYGVDWVEGNYNWKIVSKSKLRAMYYWAVTAGYTGIVPWSYKMYGNGTTSYGLVRDATVASYYNNLTGEMNSPEMQYILTLPTANYSWNYYKPWDNKVIFVNNPTRTSWGSLGYALTYRLKFDSSTNKYYLIVANKMNDVVTTNIKISGLSGSMIAVTIGQDGFGSSAPGISHAMQNGEFIDTFDAYTAHIYQICAVGDSCIISGGGGGSTPDTTPPAISITCPGDGATYTSPVTTVSGTVTDAGGMGTVRVKVGTGGAWQNATVTGNSWVINNLTGIVAGLNTIYAQATDLAGNSSPELGESINVSYSTSLPPGPPSTLLWEGIFDGDETTGAGSFNDPDGAFEQSCNPQSDSLTVVNTASLGRAGYAGKFKLYNGAAGFCKSENRVFLLSPSSNRININSLPNQELWFGWSMYQEGDWSPLGGDLYMLGADINVYNYGAAGSVNNMAQKMKAMNNGEWEISYGAGNWSGMFSPGQVENTWVDVLFHVKFSTSGSGITEVWKSTNGGAYALLKSYSGTNWFIQPYNTESTPYEFRIGIYGPVDLSNDLIVYIKDIRAATTCGDARNPSIACPDGSVGGGSGGTPPPTCTATPSSIDPCGNGVKDAGELCEKTTNQGCFGSSMCNADCNACITPPPPPPICYGIICDAPGYCQKGLGRCIENSGNPVCIYYYDTDPCEDNDGNPCKMGACSSADGGRTGFCDKAKSDVACSSPGFCQAGRGQCVATSLTDYVCSYNDDPDPCDLDGNECTLDVCKSTNGNLSSTCIATNLDACKGIVPCGRTIDNPRTNWNETAPCEFCHLVLILNRGMNFLMELVAIVSLLAMIITGLLFITSAGNPEIKNKASLALKWIIIGLIIVFIAWLLIDFLLSAWGYIDPLNGKWSVMC